MCKLLEIQITGIRHCIFKNYLVLNYYNNFKMSSDHLVTTRFHWFVCTVRLV